MLFSSSWVLWSPFADEKTEDKEVCWLSWGWQSWDLNTGGPESFCGISNMDQNHQEGLLKHNLVSATPDLLLQYVWGAVKNLHFW